MRAQRIGNRARHRAKRCLMQYDVHCATGTETGVGIDNVGFHELVPRPQTVADGPAHLIEVVAVAGLEVVDADDILSEAQQGLDQMRTDEPGASGHQPAQRLGAQMRCRRPQRLGFARVEAHQSLHTWTPRARRAAASAWHLTSMYTPLGRSLAARASGEYCRYARCATAETTASARGKSSQGVSRTPYSRKASAGSATGSWTCTDAPKETSSLTTSMTRELRWSGQFSLKVRPSTFTAAPFTAEPAWIISFTV